MPRNNAVDIAKGIAIICVVIAHAEMPGLFNRAIYLFHMPLFFITAGYFFSPERTLADPWSFVKKRFSGLYVPFVKWSLFFLLIHNLLFEVGILNETYGNWSGGVTHPYSWNQFWRNFADIVFCMKGYDPFLAGAYWFFRGLLVASLLFMVGFLLLESRPRLRGRYGVVALLVALGALGMAVFKVGTGWSWSAVAQGGYRDLMGTMFFALGFLYRRWEERIPKSLWLALAGFGVLVVCSLLKCNGMTLKPRFIDPFTLALTGTAGWVMAYNFSHWLARRREVWWRWLAVCGELSLYVFLWHVCAYKVVSLVKIWWYGLEWEQIGCHMVVHEHAADDLFWVLYTIVGVGLPIAGVYAWRSLRKRLPALGLSV